MRETVLLLADDLERKSLVRSIGPDSTVSCLNAHSLHQLLGPSVETVISGPGMGLVEEASALERIRDYAITLVFRLSPDPACVAEYVALARRLPNTRVSLCTSPNEKSLVSEVLELVMEPDSGPTGFVIERIAEYLPIETHRFLVPALALGRTRVDVRTFAGTCGVACRSIQANLRRLALPCPHRLLVWGQAFWMVWRMTRQRIGPKQAAVRGGFGTASAMRAATKPVTRGTPTNVARVGGLNLLTNKFESELKWRQSDGSSCFEDRY